MPEGPWLHLSASLVAGLAAATASNPVDVVRTRMMVQRRVEGGEAGVHLYRWAGTRKLHNKGIYGTAAHWLPPATFLIFFNFF